MTNHRQMLRDALLAVPVATLGGYFLLGGWEAIGVALSGLVTVGNFWVIMMLTFRLTAALDGESQNVALVGGLGLIKVPLALAIYTAIASYFGLLGAFLGLMVLMVPVTVRGLQFLIQTPIPSDDVEFGSTQ